MQTVYIGNTLINDVFLGSKRMDDVLQNQGLFIEFLVVGGGGGGGTPGNNSGGGGAGRAVTGSIFIQNGTYNVVVGNYADAVPSTPSTFLGIIAPGGGVGGSFTNSTNGGNGGSGGGAPNISGKTGGTAQTASGAFGVGLGNNGGNYVNGAAGGGGAQSVGNTNGNGGTGLVWNGITVAEGGNGGGRSLGAKITSGSGGRGQQTGEFAGAGLSGLVAVRYLGSPKATGGNINYDGTYTYHMFNALSALSSSFVF